MYQKLEECPSCKHTLFNNFLICKDHSISQESFALVQCNKCGLVFTNPRPDQQKIADYYDSEKYISHSNKSNSLINIGYKIARNFTLQSKYQLITKYKKSGRILDYGSGSGHFIRYMADKGWSTYAYDPYIKDFNSKSTKLIDNINKISEEDKFHVITAWHTIEHTHDLRKNLKILRKKLKRGGVMLIAVPNLDSFDATHYKQFWAAYDVPRHLYHFNRDSFKALANSVKLSIIKIYPLKLDSFYVSWLSQKYMGSNNILSAMQIALKSNQLAKSTGEYSSLIYVLKA